MVTDSYPTVWEFEEHTRIKLSILGKYLAAFGRVLLSKNPQINYFDGFAGPGEYDKGVPGSPIRALQTFKNSHREKQALCVFIEAREDRYKNLVEKVEAYLRDNPTVRRPMIIHGEFEQVIGPELDRLARENKQLHPSLFFIDPFGFSGVRLTTIRKILGMPKCEVYFNLSYNSINRFIEVDKVEEHVMGLFEDGAVLEALKKLKPGERREDVIRDHFVRALQERGGAKWVLPFRVNRDDRKATAYYLLHCTNHPLGMRIMKEVMAGEGSAGEYAYLGPEDRSQLFLFKTAMEDLAQFFLDRYKGRQMTFEELIYDSYPLTKGTAPDYRGVLLDLEERGQITMNPPAANRRRYKGRPSLPESVRIIFPG